MWYNLPSIHKRPRIPPPALQITQSPCETKTHTPTPFKCTEPFFKVCQNSTSGVRDKKILIWLSEAYFGSKHCLHNHKEVKDNSVLSGWMRQWRSTLTRLALRKLESVEYKDSKILSAICLQHACICFLYRLQLPARASYHWDSQLTALWLAPTLYTFRTSQTHRRSGLAHTRPPVGFLTQFWSGSSVLMAFSHKICSEST